MLLCSLGVLSLKEYQNKNRVKDTNYGNIRNSLHRALSLLPRDPNKQMRRKHCARNTAQYLKCVLKDQTWPVWRYTRPASGGVPGAVDPPPFAPGPHLCRTAVCCWRHIRFMSRQLGTEITTRIQANHWKPDANK